MRGGAALLVLLGHVRGFVFVDYAPTGGHWAAPFYALTSLGHQAVILFFALSGFLVGGRALAEIGAGRWSLPNYAVHRLARLWTALIPALIATAVLDALGRDVLHLAGYTGEYATILSSGPAPGTDPTTLAAFFGNIFFLQTIAVPVFGTNGPLWSLANEFWYYVLVPAAWLALARSSTPSARTAAALTVLGILIMLPLPILALASIWLAGALAWQMSDRIAALPRRRFTMLLALIIAATLAAIVIARAHADLTSDIMLGLACAAALPCLARLPNLGGVYGRLTFYSSEISFTLYVGHFPLIALLWFATLAPTQFPVGFPGFAAFAALVIAALAYATVMWWAFERHTAGVRCLMQRPFRAARFNDRPA
ncbi:acyltransferase family protein [Sphingomonas qilianensis]|uniref:Acyltransferase family protein n=1 Tax=Sphingomonas qilianensis TaxID=1736690 RepID=A0ABU9XNN7_9SPHN